MRNHLARLDQIVTYISQNPYSTCITIANHFNKRVDLIQSDVRTLYKAGLIKRRKVQSKTKGYFGQEYFL